MLLQSDAITWTLSLICLADSRDILCLLTELISCLQTGVIMYVNILSINLIKYALDFIYFKSLLERYAWLKNAFILVSYSVFSIVELQTSLGPPRFDISALEYTKHKHRLRISYTIVISRRNIPAVRIVSWHSSIVTVKLQKQIWNNTVFLNVQGILVGLLLL